jgi:hypothetical protein
VLRGLIDALEDTTDLHRSIAGEAESLTREHIVKIAPSRHKTAERLGAKPTGYYERVADGVTSRGDAEVAVVSLGGDAGGFARAFGDVTIVPRKAKNLAIPAKAAAYGKRPGEIADLELLFMGRKAGGGFALALGKKTAGGAREVWFWLVKKVFQKQDRTLLPTDDQFLAAAELGALSYLEEKVTQ